MTRRYLGILMVFFVLGLSFHPAAVFSKNIEPVKNAGKAETSGNSDAKAPPVSKGIQPLTPSGKNDLPLAIQRVYLQNGTIHVALEASGNTALKAADYAAIKLNVETPEHKSQGSWTLLQVDPQRRLTRLKGAVAFDTRMAMSKSGLAKARLTKGNQVHAKSMALRPLLGKQATQKLAHPAPLPNQAAGTSVQSSAQLVRETGSPTTMRAGSPNTGSALPPAAMQSIIEERMGGSAEPRALFYDGGIAIDQPEEGAEFDAGTTITVRYAITQEAEAGDIRFAVVRPGHIISAVTRPYTPPEPGTAGPYYHTVQLELPRFIATGDHYLIFAQLGETRVHGMSHSFTIHGIDQLTAQGQSPRLAVEIISPMGGDTVVLNAEKEIRFRIPEADSGAFCGDRVTVATVRKADGHETRIAYNLAVVPGENSLSWEVSDAYYQIGDYQLKFIMENGCVVHTAAFHVSGCDYALESVSFADGRSLAGGIDVGSGRTVSGVFRVAVRWNGIPLPPTFAPGTEWGNQLRVTATRTGQVICVPVAGTAFDYTTATSGGVITVDVPFSFERDQVARMRTESRNVPLAFSLHPHGASMDIDEGNNTMTTQMKVLNLTETDFHIGIYVRDFHLERFVHTAGTVPKYEYRFNQTINLRNRSLNDAGGAPAPVESVPIEWRVEWREAGATAYSELPLSSGRFQFTHVTGEWRTIHLSERFETLIDDAGRSYRLLVIADPDHEFLDPDRRSNMSQVVIGNPD